MKILRTLLFLLLGVPGFIYGSVYNSERAGCINLDSKAIHEGTFEWKMKKADQVGAVGETISKAGYGETSWLDAVVPGTVLSSLVYNKVFPEPYFGDNNKITNNKIPDISEVGNSFYTYWFRTEFEVPSSFKDKTIWLQPDGINYRAEIWVNGHLLSTVMGMFKNDYINITDFVNIGKNNAIAILVHPVDMPSNYTPKAWGAKGEFQNGGDGNIGLNVTQLMTVGWDFTYPDGIRDRNTGIWRGISLYATGKVALRHPFVKSSFDKGNFNVAHEDVSVEIINPNNTRPLKCVVKGEFVGEGITFTKTIDILRGEEKVCNFSCKDFAQLNMAQPKLWWPVNKGPQNLYTLKMSVSVDGVVCDSLTSRFGIRDIHVTTKTPDGSKMFIVNGKPLFIRGTNWVPEAMLRTSDNRMDAELRYTAQSGVNLLRIWGGGIAESDRFYQLCDELGMLVWQEFWLTGDTKHPQDKALYLANVESTVKRIRNHAALALYVASNESSEVTGTPELLGRLDGTRPYQMQSECDGVHDGSPYKQVNPMQHYEDSASERGSRIYGFNPEYGAPTLPVYESLKEMMDSKDLWPINKKVWDYMDGNGFHRMTSLYNDLVNQYGKSKTIEEYCEKAQFVGAMNSKSIWECWNYNKFNHGDRFCSGLLFWYHNCPNPQVSARMWDWSLEPTASLYHTANSLEPLHVQFDYLKNSVSVVNDYNQSFKGYKVIAQVFNMDSKKVLERTATVDIEEDGVSNDIIKLLFPKNISQVHFINLILKDEKGKVVSTNFYWRSNDTYQGRTTITGPCTSGFESLNNMAKAKVKLSCMTHLKENKMYIEVIVRNVGNQIAFFNQLQLLNEKHSPIRPSYYSDNFFTLLPGEKKVIKIETAAKNLSVHNILVFKGWNTDKMSYILK